MLVREAPTAVGPAAEDPQALIREARRRTRRRRLRGAAVILAIAGAALVARAATSSGGAATARSSTPAPAVERAAFAGHGVLAFISRGRLWVLDGRRGTLRAVTAPGQQASDPWFSPDRRWLGYAVDGQAWIAAADGGAPRRVGGAGGAWGAGDPWLPDGRLVAGRALWRPTPSGQPVRDGTPPAGLAAWAPDGGRYVFFSSTLTVAQGRSSSGVERLAVSSSLAGPRTTWYSGRVSFTPSSGLQGEFLDDAVVLPRREGILFRLDPDGSSSLLADGLELDEIRAPGARPATLGILVGLDVAVGSSGEFAITSGGDRYAWLTKAVERCDAATARCAPVPTSRRGLLSLDPAWSPGGAELAFVEAPSSTNGSFGQVALRRWYAAHSLWTIPRRGGRATAVAGAGGASAPVWSANGRGLLYEAGDALWLVAAPGVAPVRIAAPLFAAGRWPSYYGQVDWSGQFAWSDGTSAGG